MQKPDRGSKLSSASSAPENRSEDFRPRINHAALLSPTAVEGAHDDGVPAHMMRGDHHSTPEYEANLSSAWRHGSEQCQVSNTHCMHEC